MNYEARITYSNQILRLKQSMIASTLAELSILFLYLDNSCVTYQHIQIEKKLTETANVKIVKIVIIKNSNKNSIRFCDNKLNRFFLQVQEELPS